MRLASVERGQFPQRLILALIRIVSGMRAVDIIRTLLYRPDFFGRPISAWTQAVMRGDSAWQVWERELFAAFVSNVNKCRF